MVRPELEAGLEIIPVVNKIDLPAAEPDRAAAELASVLGVGSQEVVRVSAKTGGGIDELLERIVRDVPAPSHHSDQPLRALVFDSYYDAYRGVVCYVRVVDGSLDDGDTVLFSATSEKHQATEVGVQRVIPAYSRFSQVRFSSGKEAEKKLERWRRIARQAVQQSGAARPPDIEAPRELDSLIRGLDVVHSDEMRLFFHQDRAGADTLHRCLSKSVKIITLVVGPEGGLSPEEVDLLRRKSFVPITVGHTVLRTETAALYAIVAVQIVMHERNAWEPT